MEIQKYKEPQELTPHTVIKWSNTYKQLEILDKSGSFKTYSIRAKARRFIENGCITYNKEKKCYECLPIKGYNKTTYEMRSLGNQQFDCNCQFYQRVVMRQKIEGLICSHICALFLQLKIWNWQRRKDKELHPEAYERKHLNSVFSLYF